MGRTVPGRAAAIPQTELAVVDLDASRHRVRGQFRRDPGPAQGDRFPRPEILEGRHIGRADAEKENLVLPRRGRIEEDEIHLPLGRAIGAERHVGATHLHQFGGSRRGNHHEFRLQTRSSRDLARGIDVDSGEFAAGDDAVGRRVVDDDHAGIRPGSRRRRREADENQNLRPPPRNDGPDTRFRVFQTPRSPSIVKVGEPGFARFAVRVVSRI